MEPQKDIQTKIEEAVTDQKKSPGRLPLADHLGSDDDMRTVIQLLADELAAALARIKVLEDKVDKL